MQLVRLAVVTKPEMSASPECRSLVNALKQDGAFDVTECDVADLIPLDSDRALVFGGDGTILDAVRALGDASVPILGINVGRLGFLAASDCLSASASSIADALLNGNIVSRPLIDCRLNGSVIGSALNEVVVRAVGTRPVMIDVFVDSNYFDSYHGDGVIVATPTGSTAYSLSAGGPVLAPSLDALVINPICAHSLHSRPLVVGMDSKIELKLTSGNPATISLDGRSGEKSLVAGNIVTIVKSAKRANFVELSDSNFYKKLLDKMNDWGVTRR